MEVCPGYGITLSSDVVYYDRSFVSSISKSPVTPLEESSGSSKATSKSIYVVSDPLSPSHYPSSCHRRWLGGLQKMIQFPKSKRLASLTSLSEESLGFAENPPGETNLAPHWRDSPSVNFQTPKAQPCSNSLSSPWHDACVLCPGGEGESEVSIFGCPPLPESAEATNPELCSLPSSLSSSTRSESSQHFLEPISCSEPTASADHVEVLEPASAWNQSEMSLDFAKSGALTPNACGALSFKKIPKGLPSARRSVSYGNMREKYRSQSDHMSNGNKWLRPQVSAGNLPRPASSTFPLHGEGVSYTGRLLTAFQQVRLTSWLLQITFGWLCFTSQWKYDVGSTLCAHIHNVMCWTGLDGDEFSVDLVDPRTSYVTLLGQHFGGDLKSRFGNSIDPTANRIEGNGSLEQHDVQSIAVQKQSCGHFSLDQLSEAINDLTLMTYRKDFAPMYRFFGHHSLNKQHEHILKITSDVGWGCMIRCSQMLLFQTMKTFCLYRCSEAKRLQNRDGSRSRPVRHDFSSLSHIPNVSCPCAVSKSLSPRYCCSSDVRIESCIPSSGPSSNDLSKPEIGAKTSPQLKCLFQSVCPSPPKIGVNDHGSCNCLPQSMILTPRSSTSVNSDLNFSKCVEDYFLLGKFDRQCPQSNIQKLDDAADASDWNSTTHSFLNEIESFLLELFLDIPTPPFKHPFSIYSFIRSAGGGLGWACDLYGSMPVESQILQTLFSQQDFTYQFDPRSTDCNPMRKTPPVAIEPPDIKAAHVSNDAIGAGSAVSNAYYDQFNDLDVKSLGLGHSLMFQSALPENQVKASIMSTDILSSSAITNPALPGSVRPNYVDSPAETHTFFLGKQPGDRFGPVSSSYALKYLVESTDLTKDNIAVYINSDGILTVEEALQLMVGHLPVTKEDSESFLECVRSFKCGESQGEGPFGQDQPTASSGYAKFNTFEACDHIEDPDFEIMKKSKSTKSDSDITQSSSLLPSFNEEGWFLVQNPAFTKQPRSTSTRRRKRIPLPKSSNRFSTPFPSMSDSRPKAPERPQSPAYVDAKFVESPDKYDYDLGNPTFLPNSPPSIRRVSPQEIFRQPGPTKDLLICFPLTLGKQLSGSQLKALSEYIDLEWFNGLIGSKNQKKQALYFIGKHVVNEDAQLVADLQSTTTKPVLRQLVELLYLDPHLVQSSATNLSNAWESFHHPRVYRTPLTTLDPGLLISFYCHSLDDLDGLVNSLSRIASRFDDRAPLTVHVKETPTHLPLRLFS